MGDLEPFRTSRRVRTTNTNDVEQGLCQVVAAVRRWSINAQVMEWFDEQGRTVAVFEAVNLQ